MEISRTYGTVLESVLPFDTGKLFSGEDGDFYAIAAQLKITSYFNLGTDLEHWRNWMALKGPVLMRLDVDSTWDNAKQRKGKLDQYKPETRRGGYAVALVGYTPDAFIVRNS